MIDIENYNNKNVFAQIIRGEIPSDKIYEDDNVLAFKDINPQAPIHILIIPKTEHCSLNDFLANAGDEKILKFFKTLKKIINSQNFSNGYRLITNVGSFGGQEVPHLHFHILSGTNLGKLVP